MSEFICRRCGGTLEITLGDTVCSCSYCGVKQTVPKFSAEQKRNLFARAERYLSFGEFDSAALIYERMLTEDFNDAELYWALLLCRLGVSYVDDPQSGKRIPTINRVQSREVQSSQDYISALKYADSRQAALYTEQGAELEEIRRRILALSAVESPYDIFISCKQDDGSEERTLDSVLAQNIYTRLTAEHYRVFFSRVTLEDKAGTAFEPYIYAAINSAKVMLVVGTRQEYFNAPWVKNEWSRYLALINSGADKVIVPLFKEMPAEEIPEELSGFQAVNMSSIGFIEDLLAAVRRIAPPNGSGTVVRVLGDSSYAENAGLLLKKGDYAAADKICEQALNLDPENGEAYLLKLLAENRTDDINSLVNARNDISESANYRMAMRFCDDGTREQLKSANLRWLYNSAMALKNKADSEESFRKAAECFFVLGDYSDCQKLYGECINSAEHIADEKAAEKREREYIYAADVAEDTNAHLDELNAACRTFETLGDYKESQALLVKCKERIDNAVVQAQQLVKEIERLSKEQEKRNKRRRNIIAAALVTGVTLVVAALICAAVVPRAIRNAELSESYNSAVLLRENGDYAAAVEKFTELCEYSDSKEQILITKYEQAEFAEKNGDYVNAADIFRQLKDYRDSADRCTDAMTTLADNYAENGEFDEAIKIYERINGDEKVAELNLRKAEQLANADKYSEAVSILKAMNSTAEIREKINSVRHREALWLIENGKKSEGIKLLYELGYTAKADELSYQLAEEYTAREYFSEAIEIYKALGSYSDSADRLNETKYLYAEFNQRIENFEVAADMFEELDGYSDSSERCTENRYLYACALYGSGKYSEAAECFAELIGYADSEQRIKDAEHQKYLNCKAGDIITFGSYVQNRSGYDTQDPIEWLVLERSGNTAFVISSKILDIDVYNSATNMSIGWQDSYIRKKLNGTFIGAAFTADEQSCILSTEVSESDKVTDDKIFLLSKNEAEAYLTSSSSRRARVTDYAGMQYAEHFGVYPSHAGWWLRNTVYGNAMTVSDSGKISTYGSEFSDAYGIRPAMRITLK